jgi:hypothetical protein
MSLVGNTYFQGVEAEVEVVESGKATVKYVGYKPHHAIFEYALIGWYRKALELSGAKNVKVEFITPIKAGKGYAKSSITWTGK